MLPGAPCAGTPTLPLRWLPHNPAPRNRGLWSLSPFPRVLSFRFHALNPNPFMPSPRAWESPVERTSTHHGGERRRPRSSQPGGSHRKRKCLALPRSICNLQPVPHLAPPQNQSRDIKISLCHSKKTKNRVLFLHMHEITVSIDFQANNSA